MGKSKGDAKPKKPAEPPPGERKAGPEINEAHEGAVLENLAPTIQAGFARLYEIETELESKAAKHLDPLRQERKDAWAALRTDSGMQREELAPYFAIYKRVRDLEDFDDQTAANVLRDKMRRLYQALPTGTTMNFLDAMDGAAPNGNGHAEPPKSAFREGQRDHGIGMLFDQCPFKDGDTVNREAWQAGWLKSREEWEKSAPPGAKPSAPVEAATH